MAVGAEEVSVDGEELKYFDDVDDVDLDDLVDDDAVDVVGAVDVVEV